MQTGYFSAAWNDVKSSQGWLGKMFLLGLIAFIPVFGPVVLLGYAFGWARDIAWGVHMPMPARIFGNEDGLLYRRRLIVLAICIVCCVIIPAALEGCWDALAGRGLSNVSHAVWGGAGSVAVVSPVYSCSAWLFPLHPLCFSWWPPCVRASMAGWGPVSRFRVCGL